MGLFSGIRGRHFANGSGGSASMNPGYQRLHRWLESKIGPTDPADPGAKARMESFYNSVRSRYPSARGSVTITRSGNDTIVSGNTKPIKGRLRSLGLEWDRATKSWIGRGKTVTESDIDVPSELAGLKRYIETVPYRSKF